MKLLISSLITALLALGSQALFAQGQSPAAVGELDEDQLRGVVLEVSPEKDSLTVQPTQVGDKLDVPTEQPMTFKVDQETYVQDSVRTTILDVLRNVQVGDVVRMEFDPENMEQISSVEREGEQ
jgi:hypothetical protein